MNVHVYAEKHKENDLPARKKRMRGNKGRAVELPGMKPAINRMKTATYGIRNVHETSGNDVTKRECFEFSKLARAGEKFSAHQEIFVFEKWDVARTNTTRTNNEDENDENECRDKVARTQVPMRGRTRTRTMRGRERTTPWRVRSVARMNAIRTNDVACAATTNVTDEDEHDEYE
jgi:hypothetical protein